MANKYPYLKSTSEPLGAVEQIAAAVTTPPEEDAATCALITWFGRMLADDNFVWQYFGEKEEKVVKDKHEFAELYFNQILRYTAYDHTSYSLTPVGKGNYAVVQGKVDIKGHYYKDEHKGPHYFSYRLKKEEYGWRVQRWVLRKLKHGESALDIILKTDVNKDFESC
jgi:uncharacterized protein DUF4440